LSKQFDQLGKKENFVIVILFAETLKKSKEVFL
jgi:hypothetical protein